MAQADRTPTTPPRISHLFRDAKLKAIFARAEGDDPAAGVEIQPVRPNLTGGAARVLELA